MTPTDKQALTERIKNNIREAFHEMHHPSAPPSKSQDLNETYYVDQRLLRIRYHQDLRYVDENVNYFEIGAALTTLGETDEQGWPRFPFLQRDDHRIALRVYETFQHFPCALLHFRTIAPYQWRKISSKHMHEIFVFSCSLVFGCSIDKRSVLLEQGGNCDDQNLLHLV